MIALRCRNHQQLLQALNVRRRELNLTMAELDDRSSLQSGYSAKLFCGMRRPGPLSLDMLAAALDVDFAVIPRSATPPIEQRVGSCGHVHDARPQPSGD